MIPRIVVTGAPGSGKTKFVKRLKDEPEFSDFHFFDELARFLLEQEPELRHDRHRFHMEIYSRQVDRERRVGEKPFISDRGTVDAIAFHPEMLVHLQTTFADEYKRYSAVIQLESSAVLGEDYYKPDAVRTESTTEALEIQEAIQRAWRDHPNYHFIRANKDIEAKYNVFKDKILALVEKSRKQA